MVEDMRKHLRRIDKSVDRLGYWLGGYTIMTGFFSWAGSQMTFLKGFGWAEYLFFGLAVTAILALVLAAGMAAWRFFRPLPAVALPPPATGGATLAATVTITDPPRLTSGGFYVGMMFVDVSKAAERHEIDISARCYNGTGTAAFFQRIDGAIVAEGLGPLPPPWMPDEHKIDRIEPRAEFVLTLRQRIPDAFIEALDAIQKKDLVLDLRELQVFMASRFHADNSVALPLWNGIRLFRDQKHINVGRRHMISVGTGEIKMVVGTTNQH